MTAPASTTLRTENPANPTGTVIREAAAPARDSEPTTIESAAPLMMRAPADTTLGTQNPANLTETVVGEAAARDAGIISTENPASPMIAPASTAFSIRNPANLTETVVGEAAARNAETASTGNPANLAEAIVDEAAARDAATTAALTASRPDPNRFGTPDEIRARSAQVTKFSNWLKTDEGCTASPESRFQKFFEIMGIDLSQPQHSLTVQHTAVALRELVQKEIHGTLFDCLPRHPTDEYMARHHARETEYHCLTEQNPSEARYGDLTNISAEFAAEIFGLNAKLITNQDVSVISLTSNGSFFSIIAHDKGGSHYYTPDRPPEQTVGNGNCLFNSLVLIGAARLGIKLQESSAEQRSKYTATGAIPAPVSERPAALAAMGSSNNSRQPSQVSSTPLTQKEAAYRNMQEINEQHPGLFSTVLMAAGIDFNNKDLCDTEKQKAIFDQLFTHQQLAFSAKNLDSTTFRAVFQAMRDNEPQESPEPQHS